MHEIIYFLHFINIAILTSITSLGTSIAQGISTRELINAIFRQPKIKNELTFTNLISLALIETAGLLGLVFSIFLFLKPPANIFQNIAHCGMVLSIAIPGFLSGLSSYKCIVAGLNSMARQPILNKKIRIIIILMLSFMQTPVIFGIIIAILIQNKLTNINTLPESIELLAAGLCFAIASIGPIIAISRVTQAACKSIGKAKEIFPKLFYSFTIIAITLIETPIIFATVISMLLINNTTNLTFYKSIINLAAAITMGIGLIAPGISSGAVVVSACNQISDTPESSKQVSINCWIGQGIIETAIIYVFFISTILILSKI